MIRGHRRNHFTKVHNNGQIPAFEKIFLAKTPPVSVNFAAPNRSAHHPDHIAMTVIGSSVAVLFDSSTELGDNHDHSIFVLSTESASQIGQTLTQNRELVGKLTPARPLVDMGIPATQSQKCYLGVAIFAEETAQLSTETFEITHIGRAFVRRWNP